MDANSKCLLLLLVSLVFEQNKFYNCIALIFFGSSKPSVKNPPCQAREVWWLCWDFLNYPFFFLAMSRILGCFGTFIMFRDTPMDANWVLYLSTKSCILASLLYLLGHQRHASRTLHVKEGKFRDCAQSIFKLTFFKYFYAFCSFWYSYKPLFHQLYFYYLFFFYLPFSW